MVASGNRGGVRATKGLLLVFTLLSLVYITLSLEATENLEILTKYYEDGLKGAAKKKAEIDDDLQTFADFFQDDVDKLWHILKKVKDITRSSVYLEELPTIFENFINEKIEEVNSDLKAYRKETEDIWAIIEQKEDKHSEL